MKLKIYTKTGDKGQTSLYGGKRVGKDDQRVVAYGTVDELNSVLGVLIAQMVSKPPVELVAEFLPSLREFLLTVQSDLFVMGAVLAGNTTQSLDPLTQRIKEMEQLIDALTAQLPELKHFILPGGHPVAAFTHLTRAVCRRAEREVICLTSQKEIVPEVIIQYLNRLSDLLFMIARFSNAQEHVRDTLWTTV